MKKIIYSLMIMAGLVAMPGCNDDFMEHSPKDSLTEETVFSTYSTFKTYAWGLYNVFTNGNMLRRPGTEVPMPVPYLIREISMRVI